jgi:uncharacterized protein (DUF342 family)
MATVTREDRRFGDIAVNMNMVTQEQLDRALVVQKMVFSRSNVHMPIGKVLKEMGAVTQEQIDSILETQNYLASDEQEPCRCELPPEAQGANDAITGISLTLSKDNLTARLCATAAPSGGLTLEAVKRYLADRKVVFGLIEDELLAAYLRQDPLPLEPFTVARGIAPVPGKPSKLIYHFDIDPLKIGTLQSDGTMDWKNRGDIPQVAAGHVLVEKTDGRPGEPGTTVCGGVIPPPKAREPRLKCGKGAARSEDGRQIIAKTSGTPKLASNGKVVVFGVLQVEGDIGVETGNLDYEGYIEASGGVDSGYSVKGKGLRTAGIQDAVIEIEEDLNCIGGIYGSTVKVGGNLKAGHIHNCTIEVLGDIVVKKEIYDSAVEANGRCLIGEGKLIASTIDAKKGIYAKTIGSDASNPCTLTVGIDRKYQRDMGLYEEELTELKRQKKAIGTGTPEIGQRLESIAAQLGTLAQEQDSFMVQRRQFEQQLRGEGPNPVEDDEERLMLEEMIAELVENNEGMDLKVAELLETEDRLKQQLGGLEKSAAMLDERMEQVKETIALLDETLTVNPGIPVVKVSGTIHAKTHILARHKEITLPQDMQTVRIAESLSDNAGHKYQIKISNLR